MPQGIGQTEFWVARGSGMHSEVVHLHPSSIPKPIRKSDTDGKNVDFETVEDKRNKSVVSIMVKEFTVSSFEGLISSIKGERKSVDLSYPT